MEGGELRRLEVAAWAFLAAEARQVDPSEDRLAEPCLEAPSVFQAAAEPCLEAPSVFQAAAEPCLEAPSVFQASTRPSDDPAVEVDCTRPIREAADQAAQDHASVDRASLVGASLEGASLEVQAAQDLASLGREDQEDRPCRREVPALVDSVQTASILRS